MEKVNNKLNVRVAGVHNNKIINRIKHNIRHIRSKSQINDNNNVLIDLDSDTSYEILSVKNSLSHIMYKKFAQKYRADRAEHNKRYRKSHKRNARDYHGSWAEGVLTFSPIINQNLENGSLSQKDLIEAAKNMLRELESKWDTKIQQLILHQDEKTPHFQYMFRNYDSQGKSIVFKHRARFKLSPLQDLMYKHFKHLGMERGTKKADKDCGVYEYSKPKQTELQKLKEEIKELKSIRKALGTDISKSKEEKKKIYKEITKLQKSFRTDIKLINELKNENDRLRDKLIDTRAKLKKYTDTEKQNLLQKINLQDNHSENLNIDMGGLK